MNIDLDKFYTKYNEYELFKMTPDEAEKVLYKELSKDFPNVKYVKEILKTAPIYINSQNNKTETTPLIFAASMRHLEIVQLLLQIPEIDVNLQDIHGMSALMYATSNSDTLMIKLLLDRPEININLKNTWGIGAWGMAKPFIEVQFPKLNPKY